MSTTAADWGDGYLVDVAYIHTFLPGLAPLNLALAALLAGVRPPDVDEPFAYLDLGCGNGFTPALLAAANPHGEFWGNDFLPAHIRNAQATAATAGLVNATFVEASFADMVDADLPQFDFVVIHGIWSWVSQANRDRIVGLLARRVKPGGLVCISYNCHPGWDPLMGLRRLLIDAAGAQGAPVARIGRALATARRLCDAGADYFRNNPAASAALDQMEQADRVYLAHEYLNEAWTLFHPADVAAALVPAGLTYAGQARIIDNLDRYWLTEPQCALVEAEVDPAAAQAMRDLILDRRFRRDLFVRGPAAVDDAQVAAWFADRRFALAKPRADCSPTLTTRSGEWTLPPLCGALLDALAQSPASGRPLAELCGASANDVGKALGELAAAGAIHPALGEADEPARRIVTDRFNEAALASARMGEPVAALASPVTGSGVSLSASEQLLLDAARFGVQFDPNEGADPAQDFLRDRVPMLAMLGIA
jgi:SAM-dependent methyltransferase